MYQDARMAQIAVVAQPAQAQWRDLRAIAAIQRASFRCDLAYKWWMLAVFWLMPGVTFFVTHDGAVVTGAIIADQYRGRIRIMNIAVHPEYRKRGIGTGLMQAVLDQHPQASAVLMVQEHNAAAQGMYRQLGFQRSGYHAAYYGRGNPGIEMTLTRG
jgi:ribosomal-protein-alanine N-acetyltransferase